jgi:hypothetical protein
VEAREVAIAIGALFEGTLRLWVCDPDSVKFDKHIEIGTWLLLDRL